MNCYSPEGLIKSSKILCRVCY